MIKVNFTRVSNSQNLKRGKNVVISNRYNPIIVANNIEAHLIRNSTAATTNETQKLELIIKDRPKIRALLNFFGINTGNLKVKAEGTIEAKYNDTTAIQDFRHIFKFKELKDLTTKKEYPPENSFLSKLDNDMDTTIYKNWG